MSQKEKSKLLRNSTTFDNRQPSPRGEKNRSSKKSLNSFNLINFKKNSENNTSDFNDSHSPCFGEKHKRKSEMNKNGDDENLSNKMNAREDINYSNSGK